MNQLFDDLSNINFISICEEVKGASETVLTFRPKQGFHDNRNAEVYEIKKTATGIIVTDNGITISNLDHIYEMDEPDVTKNIYRILRQTNIKWYGKEFIYKIDTSEKICPQIFQYLQGINFIYSMKIFYT